MLKSKSFQTTFAAVFAAMLFLVAQPLLTYAQQASATINGVIYDQGGAAIAAARITVINVDTAVQRTVATNGSGAYVFLNVTPGVYTVAVEATRFEPETQSKVKLDVDQTATFDFHLKVGQAQQTVNVEADALTVIPPLRARISRRSVKEVVDLPLNGSNFTQLLTLTPGVAPVTLDQTGSGGGAFVGNALGAFSFPAVQGARVRSNIFLLDGVNNQNTFLSTNNYTPIPDAIGEFKVQTHNDDTQFGGVVGGIVNVVSASGTNRYRGTVWEFLRNEKLDANTFFNNLPAAGGGIQHPRDPLRQNVFGAAGGGPVSIPKLYNGKDRTFFFASYEGYRNRGVNQLSQISASPAMRAGDFGVLCTEGFVNGVCSNLNHQIFDPNSSVARSGHAGELYPLSVPE